MAGFHGQIYKSLKSIIVGDYMAKEHADKFPYPTARVTRHLKEEVKDKMISSKVKMATNQFLGDITAIVAEEMDKSPEKTINIDTFKRAAKPYTYANRIKEEEKEVVQDLERVLNRMDMLIRDFRQKFEIADETAFKVGHDELQQNNPAGSSGPVEAPVKKKGKSIAEMSLDEMSG